LIKDCTRYVKLFRSCISFIALLVLLGALISMGGCKTTQPASRIQYAPPVPVLERHEGPFVRVQQEDPDVRVVSQYRPKDRDHLSGPRFRHPSESMKVKEIFFQDLPLEIAAELFNELGGINLMLESGISREKVRVYLRDVTLSTALETMLRGNDLWFRTDGHVTTVMSQEAYADQMVFRQSEKIQAFFMRYTNAQDMAALLETVLGPDVELREMSGQKVYGHLEPDGEGAGPASGTDATPLTDEERQLLVRLGRAEDTLLAEEASRELGRPFPAIVTVFKKNNAIVVRSIDEGLLMHITGLIRELDTPIRQVLLETRIIRLDLGEGFESFFDFSFTDKDIDIGTLGGGLGAQTLAYIFQRDKIEARLQLFADKNRLNTMSSPFLMSADNTEVRFFVGQQVPLRTGVSKETVAVTDTQERVLFIPEVTNQEIGTDLNIKSFINADRTITMEIEADIDAPNFGVSSITLINDLTGQPINFPLDGVDKNELRSVLAVPSGNTVALSGFIRLEDQDFEQKVPLLGDIPGLGYFFKKVERRATRTETIVLITPYIIGQPWEGPDASRYFLEKSSRVLEETDKSHDRIIPEGMMFKPLD
jgi:type II secretory pathway component GspD/PulD (secretin)